MGLSNGQQHSVFQDLGRGPSNVLQLELSQQYWLAHATSNSGLGGCMFTHGSKAVVVK
jgi:hypothetical protein